MIERCGWLLVTFTRNTAWWVRKSVGHPLTLETDTAAPKTALPDLLMLPVCHEIIYGRCII